jgi:hypothetical protein
MILVPRQLQRSGMTGQVPYYGGRLTPAQIHSLQHPNEPPSASVAVPTSRGEAVPKDPKTVRRLRRLRDEGVLSEEEFATLSARVRR